MKDLFQRETVNEVISRVDEFRPLSRRQWRIEVVVSDGRLVAKYNGTGSTDTSTRLRVSHRILGSINDERVETEVSRYRIEDFLRLKFLDDNSSAKPFSHPEGSP